MLLRLAGAVFDGFVSLALMPWPGDSPEQREYGAACREFHKAQRAADKAGLGPGDEVRIGVQADMGVPEARALVAARERMSAGSDALEKSRYSPAVEAERLALRAADPEAAAVQEAKEEYIRRILRGENPDT